MAYKPQPNQRRHKQLISEAASQAELAEQELDELQRVARNDDTRSFIRGIQVRVLKIDKLLAAMMEIARLESEE